MTASPADARPLLAYRQGQLEMDGVALDALVACHGTPFFLISECRVVDNYQALLSGLEESGAAVTLRYCAKANNEAGILTLLARQGSSLLASHLAEVELGLACGFPPSRIAYQRPAPPPSEVEAVLAAGVDLLHVFRPGDVGLFASLAKQAGRRVRLSLRLRDDGRAGLSPLASLNRRLGLSSSEARAAALACRGSDWLRVTALNAYVGTQQVGLEAFDRSLRHACALAGGLAQEQRVDIEEINLGGGIPSPSLRRLGLLRLWARWRDRPARTGDGADLAQGYTPTALAAFARRLGERYRRVAATAGLQRLPALVAEPGRSIVGNAAILVAAVAAAEEGWLFLDASRNFLGESSLLFSRQLLPLRQSASDRRRFFHLSGSTLNTTDVLDLRRRLPPLAVGDTLAFCDAGAYSISRASRYAGMAPAVLLLGRDRVVRQIRRPENIGDLAGPMTADLLSTPVAADERR